MFRLLTLSITLSFILSGCVSWPVKGFAGIAEHHLEDMKASRENQPIGPEHGLRFEMELIRRHLDMLVLQGAELCFPATVTQAKLRQNRIAREINGGLEFDGLNDIIVQHKLLERLERQLIYVKQQQVCILPTIKNQTVPGEVGSRIDYLLNGNDQFHQQSAELNPIYIAQLAEAVQLLRDKPEFILRITGHADATTLQSPNNSLSMQRAQKVARYLRILGLKNERIQIDTINVDNNLFTATKLNKSSDASTRHVSIELIEKINTPKPLFASAGKE